MPARLVVGSPKRENGLDSIIIIRNYQSSFDIDIPDSDSFKRQPFRLICLSESLYSERKMTCSWEYRCTAKLRIMLLLLHCKSNFTDGNRNAVQTKEECLRCDPSAKVHLGGGADCARPWYALIAPIRGYQGDRAEDRRELVALH